MPIPGNGAAGPVIPGNVGGWMVEMGDGDTAGSPAGLDCRSAPVTGAGATEAVGAAGAGGATGAGAAGAGGAGRSHWDDPVTEL